MPLGLCRWLERAKVVWRARQCRAPTVGKSEGKEPARRRRYERLDQRRRPEASGTKAMAVPR